MLTLNVQHFFNVKKVIFTSSNQYLKHISNYFIMKLQLKINPEVEQVFKNYSLEIRNKLLNLRRLVFEVAEEEEEMITMLEEDLRWGEPSYITKHGSTMRIDWKAKTPDQYAIYFKCTSKLVPTFKLVYEHVFKFEGTRAIVFNMNEEIPETELKNCIRAGLSYHKIKQLPLLGL